MKSIDDATPDEWREAVKATKLKETRIYPQHIKPEKNRRGVYKTRFCNSDELGWAWGYSYWSGTRWSNEYATPAEAYKRRAGMGVQTKEWRGLAREPK